MMVMEASCSLVLFTVRHKTSLTVGHLCLSYDCLFILGRALFYYISTTKRKKRKELNSAIGKFIDVG